MPGSAPQRISAPNTHQPGHPSVTHQQPPQQGSVAPEEEQHFGDLLTQAEYTTEKAQSAKDTELCPDCGSQNYVAPAGHPNAMKQCFNCGWNPRFQHSTHGASGIGQNLPTKTARSQTMSENSFNPGMIVGRVG